LYRQTCSLTRGAPRPHGHQSPRNLREWQLRELSPRGVDAVSDHLGPSSVKQSYTLLDQSGILVVYGIAADLDSTAALAPRPL
jgi:NADPH:quinone reductase-like Zn-dependent oxidoreductase